MTRRYTQLIVPEAMARIRELEAAFIPPSESSAHSDTASPTNTKDLEKNKRDQGTTGPCEECARNRRKKQVNFNLDSSQVPRYPRPSQHAVPHPPIFGQRLFPPSIAERHYGPRSAMFSGYHIHPNGFLAQGPIPHPYTPAQPLHNLGFGPFPLFGWESVTPLPHPYGQPGYVRRVKPDYRRFCFSVGKADVPYAALPGGPLWRYPTTMSPQLVGRW